MRKRMTCLLLTLALGVSQAATVSASLEDELREEQAWTYAQLDSIYAQIDEYWYQKQQLEAEIAQLDQNLVNVMVSIDILKGDIANKEVEIANTRDALKKAKKAKKKQYEDMKQRIQYLYENGGDDAWFQMLMSAENLSDLLTRAEYTQEMYDYDREALEKYVNTVSEVKSLKEKYEQDKAELEGMKQEYEAESYNLQCQIDEKRAASASYDDEIAWATQMANDYVAIIQEQQAEIERLEAERIAAEEQARMEAEAAAAAAAAEAEPVYDEYGNETDLYTAAENGETVYDGYGNEVDAAETVANIASGSGSSVVDYATQFVGNPYVWGGTSLTNGADCSGFVQSVYSNFGVSLPRTSYEQQNAGREVSYSDAQPGDLICYGGHVAIYMGNGRIVHASNSRDGIKISDNAAYRTIVSVRRLVE